MTDKAGRLGGARGPQAASTSPEVSMSFYLQTSPLSLGHMTPFQEQKRIFAKAAAEAHTSLVLEVTRTKEFIKSKEGPQIIIWRPHLLSTTTHQSRMEAGGRQQKKKCQKIPTFLRPLGKKQKQWLEKAAKKNCISALKLKCYLSLESRPPCTLSWLLPLSLGCPATLPKALRAPSYSCKPLSCASLDYFSSHETIETLHF